MTVRTANALQAGVRTDYCIWKLCIEKKRFPIGRQREKGIFGSLES